MFASKDALARSVKEGMKKSEINTAFLNHKVLELLLIPWFTNLVYF